MTRCACSRGARALLLAAPLLAALPAPYAPIAGQGTPEEALPSFGETFSVGYVLVPVIVRAGSGYARGLDRGDFRLEVDGRRVAIESFEPRAEAPASLVFLQDLSGSMENAGKLEASREAVRYFLERAKPGDEFAVASFAGGEERIEVPFTGDVATVRQAVDAWEAYGTTALHDAVAKVPEISAAGNNAKRFILLVTDGLDNASRIPPAEARRLVRKAQLPVYVLGLRTGNPYEVSPEGKKVYRYADVLNLLAHMTGGRYLPIDGLDDLKDAVAAIEDDLRHQYVLGFSTGDGRSRFRDLKVAVAGDGRRAVAFRRGYTGPPPSRPPGNTSSGG
ncbi:MAG TPA: VWA domain-containing protein [Thermoanaerobaculia bacterium]|nr:VWA domain-containing protein [Thermoanaerobaculia bacterium]